MKKGILFILMTFLLAVLGCGTIRAASAPKLSETSLQLQKGESAILKLKGAKEKRVKWISKNNEIASVEKGIVKAEGAGTTKIIAKYKGKKYICKITVTEAADDPVDEPGEDETQRRMLLTIDGARLDVEWESNDSVEALKKLLPLTISMSEYGGFEQVGDLGTTLPRSDERITTAAGDIVLYNGDEIYSATGERLDTVDGSFESGFKGAGVLLIFEVLFLSVCLLKKKTYIFLTATSFLFGCTVTAMFIAQIFHPTCR